MGDEVVTGYFKSFDRALSGREERDCERDHRDRCDDRHSRRRHRSRRHGC
jgi:hypothetical protein